MALLTVDEFKASPQYARLGQDLGDDEIEEAMTEASATLTRVLGYSVEDSSTAVSVYVPNRTQRVYLPARARTVSSVTVDGSSLAASSYRLSEDKLSLLQDSGWFPSQTTVAVSGTFGFTAGEEKYVLAKKAMRLLTLRILSAAYADDDVPFSGYVTSHTSGETTMTFFTPKDSYTGDVEIDRIIKLIGVHPRGKSKLWTVAVTAGAPDVGTFDDIVAGRRDIEDL